MKKRFLGKKLEVSAVGLGCMGLSHAFGAPLETKDAVSKIREAHEIGYTLFDTAECYTGLREDGTTAYNEEVVGEALRPIRDDVKVATKFGVSFGENTMILDSSPKKIRESIDGSLRRMGLDYVDLYYQHRIDPTVEPEIVAETMAQLIKEGKILNWGISEVDDADYLRRAHAVCPVAAVQNIYSMVDRETEKLFPVFEELGVSMVCYTPLAKGFLSGDFSKGVKFEDAQDNRSGRYQFSDEGFEKYQAVLDMLKNMAESKNATLAQVSLAWMLCKKPWIVPIPGTRRVERMKENAGASEVILSDKEISSIDNALDSLHLKNTAEGWFKVKE